MNVAKNENFNFFALLYLNDWYRFDRGFISGLSVSQTREIRRKCLERVANDYRVARNFKKLNEEADNRLARALDALDSFSRPNSGEDVDSAVIGLSEKFCSYYGTNAVSAASKFLWMQYQSPVIIFDGRAVQCLSLLKTTNYPTYRKEWLSRYSEHEPSILKALTELPLVKKFSLAHRMPDTEFGQLIANKWFQERVFDKFLWWNAKPANDFDESNELL